MNNTLLFTSELLISLTISLGLIVLITPLLRQTLTEICGTQLRASFWVRYVQLMFTFMPLLIVVFLSKSPDTTSLDVLPLLQDTLSRSLIGIFIALIAVGYVMRRAIQAMNDSNSVNQLQDESLPTKAS